MPQTREKVPLLGHKDVLVPLTVPKDKRSAYIDNFLTITRKTGRLFLFAADHKIEHLNKDFWGLNIPCEKSCPDIPKHLFEIAKHGEVGAFCTQLGLIARMAGEYNDVDYLVKMNSKTDIVHTEISEPISRSLCTVDDVISLRDEHNIKIRGIGYTIYLGSTKETEMLAEGSRMILDAHRQGLVAVLWVYPRGISIHDELNEDTIAGAAGAGAALGADFVKVRVPRADTMRTSAQRLVQATRCAGNTGVICAGGKLKSANSTVRTLYQQITLGGTRGCAIGRNIYQRPLNDAIKMCKALSGIVDGTSSLEDAIKEIKDLKP